jgi:hypothetical protein
MKLSHLKHWLVAGVVAAALTLPQSLWACSVCFGDPNAAQTKGVNSAVLGMIGVTAVVLGGFVALIIAINLRARRHQAMLAASATEGTQP